MTTDRTIIALGCSTNHDYAFLLPLTALLWRDVVGHHPLLLLVGDEAEWRRDRPIILGALDEHQLSRVWLGHLAGYADATLAQNARQHACAVPDIFPDTFVMPSDADLWPLRRDFYWQHYNHRMTSYYSNGDHFQGKTDVLVRAAKGLRSQTLPTCHVAMRARDWRAIYEICGPDVIPDGDVAERTRKTLDEWFTRRSPEDGDAGMTRWMSDQQIMTEKLVAQDWFPKGVPQSDTGRHANGDVLFIPRRGHPPMDRLDRSNPPSWSCVHPRHFTDAHVFRSPWVEPHWTWLRDVFNAVLPKYNPWARDYHRKFAGEPAPMPPNIWDDTSGMDR